MSIQALGGLFNLELKNLVSERKIFKISNTVFSYDIINYNINYIKSICKLLDLGTKFVPSLFNNNQDYYVNILKDLDNTLLDLNQKIFFSKNNQNKSNNFDTNQSKTLMNKLKPLNENSRDLNKYNIPLQHEVIDLRTKMIPALFNFKPKKIISNINS